MMSLNSVLNVGRVAAAFAIAVVGLGSMHARAQPAVTVAGYVVPIGGALKHDNDEIWSRLVALAGGAGAKYVVFATASDNPERSGEQIVATLNKYGAVAEFIPLAPKMKGRDVAADARDPMLVAKVKAARGVFFSGGAQERIVDAMVTKEGKRTPILDAIWGVFEAGGVIAGTSAGAAIASTHMFRDPPSVLASLQAGQNGLKPGRDIDRGLGFVADGVFVDQHFLKRGRIGRLLPVMVQTKQRIGIGVEENSAVVIHQGMVEVLTSRVGRGGALIVDLAGSKVSADVKAFNIRHARIHLLQRGDRFELASATPMASPLQATDSKIDPNAADANPYHRSVPFYADILGDGALVNAMSTLVDSKANEARGLAFAPLGKNAGDGFEFRLFRTSQSVGFFRGGGSEQMSVFHLGLDVLPVRIATPLYRALDAGTSK